jgi:hypothetical protein
MQKLPSLEPLTSKMRERSRVCMSLKVSTTWSNASTDRLGGNFGLSASRYGRRRMGFGQDRAADLIRGDGPYAVPAIGLASSLSALARSGPSRGFPCQIRRGSEPSRRSRPQGPYVSRQPTGAGPAGAGAAA